MGFLASWLAAQRVRRVVFIAGLFPLPGLSMLGAATVIMTASVRGPREAAFECGLALLLLSGIAWASGMHVPVVAGSAALSWSVWLLLGAINGRSGSLQLAIQAAVLLALAGLVILLVTVGDGVVYWQQVLDAVYQDLAEQGVKVEANVAQQAGLMNGLIVAGSFLGSILALLLGSFWASKITNGDFSRQFRELRLGYVIGGLAALAGIAALAGLANGGAVLIFGAAFMFQGIGVVAWWSGSMGWPRGWWIGLCILPILIPNLLILGLMLFATIGFIDNWYSLRRKLA